MGIYVGTRACVCACVGRVCIWLWCACIYCLKKVYKHAWTFTYKLCAGLCACCTMLIFTKVYEHARTISTSTECMWMCDCELCACAYFVKPYWNIFSMWTCLNNPLQVLDAYDWMRMHTGVYVRGSAHDCACSGHLLSVYRRLHLCDWCGWGICSGTGKG